MFCHRCGTQVGNAAFCPNCGQSLAASSGAAAPAITWTAPSGIQADSGRWLGEAWNLVMADLGAYVVITLLFFLISCIPFVQGALIAGLHIYTIKKVQGRNPEVGDFLKGFNFFVPALVASLVIGFFTFLGTLAFIIPGLVIAAMYKFTYLFIVDKRMDFWQAMKASHAVVKNDYFGFTIFLILAFLVNVLGALCLFVGLLVTIPMTFAAITIAYREIVGFEPQTATSY
jgi:uncharacterized membrane protein